MLTGRIKQRSYETSAGEKRTVFEVEADEIGPSLKFATAKVNKVSRSGGGTSRKSEGNEDPWGNAPGSGFGGSDEPPPF